MISLVVVSGRSGSGKSTALHVLEDMGYYCIDNLPVTLLVPLVDRVTVDDTISRVAVSIDARNIASDLSRFPALIESLDTSRVSQKIIFLDSDGGTLVKRFSETRRKHPLSSPERDLREALELESQLLDPISARADLTVDTTRLTIHELRDLVKSRVAQADHEFALLFQSFAFKNGVPVDSDFVFDVRSLPNPHWKPNLRPLTGLDADVQAFLESQGEFRDMFGDLASYLDRWLPGFEANNRSYMTVSIGCTGGQHRSVYLAEKLHQHFQSRWHNVQIRHRELVGGMPDRRTGKAAK